MNKTTNTKVKNLRFNIRNGAKRTIKLAMVMSMMKKVKAPDPMPQ